MAITTTTLSIAISAATNSFAVASATGITAPNFQSGSGITVLGIDQELMLVTAVSGTLITVLRGQYGTFAASHAAAATVQIGLPTDFANPTEVLASSLTSSETVGSQTVGSQTVTAQTITAQTIASQTLSALNVPAVVLNGATDAIPSTVPGFYVVKTAGVNAMTLAAPTAAQEGNIIWVMSDTLNAHTITATSLFANGTALKTTATFPAFRGASVMLRACNLVWHVLSCGPVATATGATGVVVFS